jgi:hypothetical protein
MAGNAKLFFLVQGPIAASKEVQKILGYASNCNRFRMSLHPISAMFELSTGEVRSFEFATCQQSSRQARCMGYQVSGEEGIFPPVSENIITTPGACTSLCGIWDISYGTHPSHFSFLFLSFIRTYVEMTRDTTKRIQILSFNIHRKDTGRLDDH